MPAAIQIAAGIPFWVHTCPCYRANCLLPTAGLALPTILPYVLRQVLPNRVLPCVQQFQTGVLPPAQPLPHAYQSVSYTHLIIEVHNDPAHALSDGAQSLTPDQFDHVAKRVFAASKALREDMVNEK